MVREIIRFIETNLNGNKTVKRAIRDITGISFMFSNAVSKVSGFGDKKIGELSEDELKKLEEIIMNPEKFNIPNWMYNRRKDPKTGENKHLLASKLKLIKKIDIDRLKKIRTYKGIRHSLGLPVRGQRTRGSFRKGKVVGVKKSKKLTEVRNEKNKK